MITETSPIIIEWIPSCETTKIMRTKIQAMNRKGRPNKGKHEWEVTGEWMAAGVKRRGGGKKTFEIRQFQVSFLFLVAVSIFDCQRSPTNESLASRRPSTPQKTPHEIPPLQFLFPFFFRFLFSLPSLSSISLVPLLVGFSCFVIFIWKKKNASPFLLKMIRSLSSTTTSSVCFVSFVSFSKLSF